MSSPHRQPGLASELRSNAIAAAVVIGGLLVTAALWELL
jgi:hypothetical protein